MKEVEYVGNNTFNYGRFGLISNGSKMEFFEWEWLCEKDNSDFKLLSKQPSKEELEIARKVKPTATPIFDLRTVPWENKKLKVMLSSRTSKSTMIKIIRAINFAGGNIPASRVGEHRNALMDKILEAAYFMGWDTYTKQERMSFGEDVPVVEQAEEVEEVEEVIDVEEQEENEQQNETTKATRQRVRKV